MRITICSWCVSSWRHPGTCRSGTCYFWQIGEETDRVLLPSLWLSPVSFILHLLGGSSSNYFLIASAAYNSFYEKYQANVMALAYFTEAEINCIIIFKIPSCSPFLHHIILYFLKRKVIYIYKVFCHLLFCHCWMIKIQPDVQYLH